MSTDTPTSVYKFHDGAGRLIYVGITSRGITRQLEHNQHSAWWGFSVHQEIEHYDSRAQAAARETELIRAHHPPFNTSQNDRWQTVRPAYLALREAEEGYRATHEGWQATPAPRLEVVPPEDDELYFAVAEDLDEALSHVTAEQISEAIARGLHRGDRASAGALGPKPDPELVNATVEVLLAAGMKLEELVVIAEDVAADASIGELWMAFVDICRHLVRRRRQIAWLQAPEESSA